MKLASSNWVSGDIDVRPLSSAMGAEVRGVDLARPLTGAVWNGIRDAFRSYLLLSFPDQSLNETQQIAFSRRFGQLQVHVLDQYRHPEFPEIYLLSNVDRRSGATIGHHPDKGTLVWHSDLSFQRCPALATMLYGLEVPRTGGDTLFADMYAAYDALAETMRKHLAGLRATHDLDFSRQRAGERPMTDRQRRAAPPVDHPMVRTHPETGRRSLYISHHVSRIDGMSDEESQRLLAELMAHATSDRFVYRHQWRKHDLVVWDNRCTMHRATEYDPTAERRIMHRTVVLGDIPV